MPSDHLRGYVCRTLFAVCLLSPALVGAQVRQRRVEKVERLLTVPEPLEVLEIRVGGGEVLPGQSVSASEDWLEGVAVKVRNVSGLSITYAEYEIEAMASEAKGVSSLITLKYGRAPTGGPRESSTPGAVVRPGECFELSVDGGVGGVPAASLYGARGRVSFDLARISLSLVVFEGDRGWRNGRVSRRDTVHPERWYVTDETLNYIKPVVGLPEVGSRAPGVAVVTIDGRRFDLAAMRGKVVVLNFWSLGCVPCLAEIPALNKLVEAYVGRNVYFLAISPDGSSALRSFLKDVRFRFIVIPDGTEVLSRYGSAGFPRHIVIDKDGFVRWAHTGNMSHSESELKAAIDDSLRKQ